jgi:2-alkyl-3-oxoalkanoate reductase
MMAIVHIDDAVAALTAEAGVYNIVDDDPLPVAEWLSPGGSMRRNRPA